jgi:hypothetical protein
VDSKYIRRSDRENFVWELVLEAKKGTRRPY